MYNREELLLKEPKLQFGTVATPNLITASTDPKSFFTAINDLGYIKMGSISKNVANTYADYKQGTPHKMIRRDLTERVLTWKLILNQQNPTIYKIFENLYTESGTYSLAFRGNDAPVRPQYAYLMEGYNVAGVYWAAMMYAGEVVTPDMTKAFSGTAHVDLACEILAFEHPAFTTLNSQANDVKNYGVEWEVFDISS